MSDCLPDKESATIVPINASRIRNPVGKPYCLNIPSSQRSDPHVTPSGLIKTPRKDRFGRVIDRKAKAYHVSFRDTVSKEQVADVNEVESYKKYNSEAKSTTQCSCNLL